MNLLVAQNSLLAFAEILYIIVCLMADDVQEVWKPLPERDDRVRAKRGGRGERNGSAKLTWEKVREIRAKAREGVMQKDLALEYNVSIACISNLVNKRHWKE